MKRSLKRSVGTLAIVLLSAAPLAACGSKGAAAAGTEKRTIGVSFAAPTIALYAAIQKGISEQAKKAGVDVVFTDAGGDPAKQANDINDLIARGVDGLLVSGIDANAIVAPLQAAAAAHIPVMTVARDAPDSKLRAAFIGNDWSGSGADIARWTCKNVGKGKIVMIEGPSVAPYVQEMTAAYKAEIGSVECPGMKVAYETNLEKLTADEGLKATKEALTRVPDATVVYANLDDFLPGVLQAINEAGRRGKVTVTGFDGIPETLEMVRKGDVGFEIGLQPTKWGATAMRSMLSLLDGNKVADTVTIDTLPFDKTNADEINVKDLE